MDSAGYLNLTRQMGLLSEMQTLAQNVANSSTVGYRREGIVFSEFVNATGDDSVSMASARARFIDESQGVLNKTGGVLDFAIEGDGYFRVETPDGERLTRAGNFALNPQGELVTPEGLRVLSADGAAIVIPEGEGRVSASSDGEISVGGNPVGQLGIAQVDPKTIAREGNNLFRALEGTQPAESARVTQGFLEQSNVNSVTAISRLIEVQRAYELGQGMLEREHDRVSKLIQTLGRQA